MNAIIINKSVIKLDGAFMKLQMQRMEYIDSRRTEWFLIVGVETPSSSLGWMDSLHFIKGNFMLLLLDGSFSACSICWVSGAVGYGCEMQWAGVCEGRRGTAMVEVEVSSVP